MGQIMGACTYPIVNIEDVFVADARACEQAIRFAFDLRFRCVQIEGDSLTIVKQVNSCTVDRSTLRPIVEDIKGRLRFFDRINFLNAIREANVAAHVLAREGPWFSEERCWVKKAPKMVERMVAVDLI
ncbi:hypothetical protein PVK06_034755 [Gossypium arboreum]|uniref:RNase H type-1 domain-containing protein n=1 Tax=Gossypium arboreum TaxID=29729 RepID=A0ABR0NF13_GOSAR|nr:hypothetical protein PVK06_034755 [Gossypium arboreum]